MNRVDRAAHRQHITRLKALKADLAYHQGKVDEATAKGRAPDARDVRMVDLLAAEWAREEAMA